MKKIYLITAVFAVSLLSGFAGICFGQDFFVKDKGQTIEEHKYAPMEIVVKFKPGVDSKTVQAINQKHGTAVIKTSRFAGFKRLRVPKGRTVEQMIAIYSKNPNVEYAEPNYIAHAFTVPNDEFYSYQWHLDNADGGGIGMEEAWEISTGAGVIVAVIDTGVAYEDYEEAGVPVGNSGKYRTSVVYAQAPDLAITNFVPGYDFVNDDEHPNDDEGHGTHVAGTIAQSTDNGIGTAGVAYNCSIMPVKVLDSNGSGTYTDIADGIYFATDYGAQVINMSLGGSVGSDTLGNALFYAYDHGVTIVCASGNDAADTISYPAAYDAYCIAVGATRYDETVSWYSNRGSSLDLTAPGGDTGVDQNVDGYVDGVLQQTHDGTDYTNFGYYFYQGTSMAAPHVAGVAALVIANGVTGPDNVREVLQSTAEDKSVVGWDTAYGWGIVDAAAALGYFAEPNFQPVADAGGPYNDGIEDIAVTFDGSGSYDDDTEDTLVYAWQFGDGTTGSGIKPTHVYVAGGTYTVTLTVSDGKEDSLPDTTTVYIIDVNDQPVADAGGPSYTGTVGIAVTFDGSGSYDIDKEDILNYSWDFGDDTIGSGINPTHVYFAEGDYTVTLTVSDGEESDQSTATVTVTPAGGNSSMHIEDIVMSLKTAGINTSALATITIFDENDVPLQGATVSGGWSFATSDSDTGITDADGLVILESDKLKRPVTGTTFTFTVNDVSLSGREYTPAENVETSDYVNVP